MVQRREKIPGRQVPLTFGTYVIIGAIKLW